MLRLASFVTLFLAFAGALPACGSLDTQTASAPTLATVSGELVNPSAVVITGSVRVAVVWKVGLLVGGGGGLDVAEDLPVQASFPALFTIQITDPPPASALVGGDPAYPDTSVAEGIIVAYVDKNGNGKLDLVGSDAGAYVDQILATSGDIGLYYVSGPPPFIPDDAGVSEDRPGYNLFSACLPGPNVTEGSICPPPACDEGFLPMTTMITLTASSDLQASSLLCTTGAPDNPPPFVAAPTPGRPATYPSPCDLDLFCAEDGSSYIYGTCQYRANDLCPAVGDALTCSGVEYDRPSPVPSDWPCKS